MAGSAADDKSQCTILAGTIRLWKKGGIGLSCYGNRFVLAIVKSRGVLYCTSTSTSSRKACQGCGLL